jgi:23S rRNA U2552 (ribose-2'-O)-methylase RlmE/FtsJ
VWWVRECVSGLECVCVCVCGGGGGGHVPRFESFDPVGSFGLLAQSKRCLEEEPEEAGKRYVADAHGETSLTRSASHEGGPPEHAILRASLPVSFGRKRGMTTACRPKRVRCRGEEVSLGSLAQAVPVDKIHWCPWDRCAVDGSSSAAKGGVVKPPFISRGGLEALQAARSALGDLSREAFVAARAAVNPLEGLGRGVFLNRSAMKLLSIDAAVGLLPGAHGDKSAHGPCGSSAGAAECPAPAKFTFLDVCGGPGGFVEYLLRTCADRRASCEGWGITVRGSPGVDWQLDASGPHESFHKLWGADGTGNVYNPDNIRAVVEAVRLGAPAGVDLVTADGGFAAARDSLDQADRMYRLVLCQLLLALQVVAIGGSVVCKVSILGPPPPPPLSLHTSCPSALPSPYPLPFARPGAPPPHTLLKAPAPSINHPLTSSTLAPLTGPHSPTHCLLTMIRPSPLHKVFDVHTRHMGALLFQLKSVFEEMGIMKPSTSRPASSERYVVCRGAKAVPASLISRLYDVNASLGSRPCSVDGDPAFAIPPSPGAVEDARADFLAPVAGDGQPGSAPPATDTRWLYLPIDADCVAADVDGLPDGFAAWLIEVNDLLCCKQVAACNTIVAAAAALLA